MSAAAPLVAVVGGGLAGIRAALDCADAGLRVVLFERRPRLGGATWSVEHRGLAIDNGQHVAMRCCTAYLELLQRLGSRDQLELQPRLAVPVARPGRPLAWIRRSRLPAPGHLGPSLLRFDPLPLGQRFRSALTALRFLRLDPDDAELDAITLGSWLAQHGEPETAIDGLWDLLIRPTLNLAAREASLALATKVLRTGFLERADAADVGVPRVPFDRLHAEPATRALEKAGVDLRLRHGVDAIEVATDGAVSLRVSGEQVNADAVVLATPHDMAAGLLPAASGVAPDDLRALGHSAIVNLHVVFDRPVLELPFLAALDSPVQWVFDRTGPAGLASGQYLTLSLSAGESFLGEGREALRETFVPALRALLPAAREARCTDFFATNEPTATFRQGPGTRRLRPSSRTALPGLFLAGAWTDTGWPDTMEGAARSGRSASEAVLEALGQPRRSATHLPEAA